MSGVGDGAGLEIDGGAAPPNAGRSCPACGAGALRERARFCATCGRLLGGGYCPPDLLLSSYRQQRRRPEVLLTPSPPAAARPVKAKATAAMPFSKHTNGAAANALAFVTYSLVPYLGIIFCPGALVCGSVGLLRARRSPHVGGGRPAAYAVVLAVIIFCVQLLLWWVLYKVPEWSRRAPF